MSDPAAELSQALARLWRAHRALDADAVGCADPVRVRRLRREMQAVMARVHALEALLVETPAASAAGLLGQLVLAAGTMHLLADSDPPQRGRLERRLIKLLYGAIAALERIDGLSRAEVAGRYYLLPADTAERAVAGEADSAGTAGHC